MGQRAIRLTDDQKELIAPSFAPRDHHALAMARVIAIPDTRLTLLIPGSMTLLRQRPGQPICAMALLERVLMTGTRSAESIMVSGHGQRRVKRPDAWQRRPAV